MFLSRLILLAVIPLFPALTADASPRTLRLALIEDNRAHLSMHLSQPLEKLIESEGPESSILSANAVACRYSPGSYRVSLRPEASGDSQEAAFLETGDEVALIFPPDPSLIAGFMRAARDPSTYRRPWSLELSSSSARIERQDFGGSVLTTISREGADRAHAYNATMGTLYLLRWKGRKVSVILTGPVFGGIARLSAALDRERENGPLLGLARDGIFGGWTPAELKGAPLAEALEEMGLEYSAIAHSELRRWEDFKAYRGSRPSGIKFLSANLVYSSAPTVSLFPGSAVIEREGLRIALIGLTPSSAAKYLAPAGLGHLKISDPVDAVNTLLPELRDQADVVILLADLSEESAPLTKRLRGIDIILARDARSSRHRARPPSANTSQRARPKYARPLWAMNAYHAALSLLEVTVRESGEGSDWAVSEWHIPLEDGIPSAPGLPVYDPKDFGIAFDAREAFIPSARRIFPAGSRPPGYVNIGPRDFWSMAGGLLADETRSEASLLRVWPLGVRVDDDISEGVVRTWLRTQDPAVIVSLKGRKLKKLLKKAARQKKLELEGLPHGGRIRFTAGGVGPGQTIHGLPIDANASYRIATTRVLAESLGLPAPKPIGDTVDDIVFKSLQKAAGSPPAIYRKWMEGRPVREGGLWRINFRDISLNISKTQVVRDNAFDQVSDSRVQGLDELLVGGILKVDANYLKRKYKWSNTLQLEYAESRIKPRNKPAVINTSADRIDYLTRGTLRKGSFPWTWFARDWGPAMGFEFQSQFKANPGLRRKEIYILNPGIEFYNGSVIKSFTTSLSIKRDFSRGVPNNQYGMRARAVGSHALGGGSGAKLQGEAWSNYYFLTKKDLAQDLRLEGDLNLKLQIPLWKHLTLAPFIDLYFFELKVRPIAGYNIMMGISLGFSRIWKPQYEDF